MKESITQLVQNALTELNDDFDFLEDGQAINEKLALFGEGGCLTSVALVSLISDIEERLSDEMDQDIVLANEKTMSMRNSPFKSVASLVDYIGTLLSDPVNA